MFMPHRKGPLFAPPPEEEAPSSLNTSMGGGNYAFTTGIASPHPNHHSSRPVRREGNNTTTTTLQHHYTPVVDDTAIALRPTAYSQQYGIAAPFESYLLDRRPTQHVRLHPDQQLPYADTGITSPNTSTDMPLKPNPINVHRSAPSIATRNHRGEVAQFTSPPTEDRELMPLLASAALLDAAIRRNQKLLSSGEMPFKPHSIDHKSSGKKAPKRLTSNDLKEELLEVLVVTERALDRHYSCPSDLRILAGIAVNGTTSASAVPANGHTRPSSSKAPAHNGNKAEGSSFAWLQSPQALGPRNVNIASALTLDNPRPLTAPRKQQPASIKGGPSGPLPSTPLATSRGPQRRELGGNGKGKQSQSPATLTAASHSPLPVPPRIPPPIAGHVSDGDDDDDQPRLLY